jgi:phage-related baseplate assembly protein
VEALDFETLFKEMLADLSRRDPAFSALVESDSAYKVLQVCAYRELLLRARINDAAHAVMLASAMGSNLDHLAALFGVQRQLIDPGKPAERPPIPPSYESDERLRQRTQEALEGFSTAGPVGAYRAHALAASPRVKDVNVQSPTPGEVLITVLSIDGDGAPGQALIDSVAVTLNDENVRPLTDRVRVQAAQIVHYRVEAYLELAPGPDAEVLRQRA